MPISKVEARKVLRKLRQAAEFYERDVGIYRVFDALDCARWAPNIANETPWEFILVKEESNVLELKKIMKIEANPSLFVVFAFDTERILFFNKNLNEKDALLLGYLYAGEAVTSFIAALRDVGISSRLWFIASDVKDRIKQLLDLTSQVVPVAVVGVGFAKSYLESYRLPLKVLIHVEKFGEEWKEKLPAVYSKRSRMDLFQKIFI